MKVFGSGLNSKFLLGLQSDSENSFGAPIVQTPKQIDFVTENLSHICSSDDSTLLTYQNGDVYVIGDNRSGNIFSKEFIIFQMPTKLPIEERIKMTIAGESFTLYLTTNGDLLLFTEQCQGETLRFSLPSPVVFIFSLVGFPTAIDEEGSLFLFFSDDLAKQPKKFVFEHQVVDVACSMSHIHVLLADGSVMTSDQKYIDNIKFIVDESLAGNKIKQLSGNFFHCLALSESDEVFACGINSEGQFGNGNFKESENSFIKIDEIKAKQVAVGDSFSLFLCEDGKVKACGKNINAQLLLGNSRVVKNISEAILSDKISFIITGGSHSYAISGWTMSTNLMKNESMAINDGKDKIIEQLQSDIIYLKSMFSELKAEMNNLKVQNSEQAQEIKNLKEEIASMKE